MHNEAQIAIMTWQSWITLGIIVAMIIALAKEWFSPDITLGAALAILMGTGVLSPKEALEGFSNHGLLTIGALFIVAQAVSESGGLTTAAMRILGRTSNITLATLRLMLPTLGISAFLNNTPVVVMFIPVVRSWAERNNFSPSKLLIPLSYASILGGMCTLIGTSTNLVVSGMMVDHGYDAMGMFEIAKIGFPAAVLGLVFMVFAGHRLLPGRQDITDQLQEAKREYLVEMIVKPDCSLIGKSIEEAGLRHLKGLFLIHIERREKVIGPVSPDIMLEQGDRLRFTGLISTIVDLNEIRGLIPAEEATLDFTPKTTGADLRLFEVVVAASSPLVGMGIREAGFRNRYDAVVIAVHRAGQRIVKKMGDIVLRSGDTLLLEAPEGFARRWYNSTHFYLVSRVGDVKRIKHEKASLVLTVLAAMIALPALGITSMIISAFGAAAILLIAKAISPSSARRAVDLSIMIVIASALGLGAALEKTELASMIASFMVNAGYGTTAVIAAVLILTNIFTELVTNKAAAALFFPVALSAAEQLGADPRPFMLAVAIGAAASFATPLGYQTNLIVYGPGGYRFTDFLRVGIFMNLLVITTGALAISWWWNV